MPDGDGRITRRSDAGRVSVLYSNAYGIGEYLIRNEVTRALWSATSPELFYRRGEELVAVDYGEQAGEFRVLAERALFRLPAFELIGISPDGSRFLAAVAAGPAPPDDVAVVLNWPAQVPASRK